MKRLCWYCQKDCLTFISICDDCRQRRRKNVRDNDNQNISKNDTDFHKDISNLKNNLCDQKNLGNNKYE